MSMYFGALDELGVGQTGHRGLQVQRRCEVGVDGHPDERGQLAVRKDAQQVHDGGVVGGVIDRRVLHGFGA